MHTPRTLLLTCVAMLAFAANSLLARQALSETETNAAAFTVIRLLSGAFALVTYVRFSRGAHTALWKAGSALGAAALFVYAAAFSFAYVRLPAATGALILFGTVQITLIGVGWWRGERLSTGQRLGVGSALLGFVALMAPGASAPSTFGALLMVFSGIAWGTYTLLGRTGDPVATTAGHFVRVAPLALLLALLSGRDFRVDALGGALALASGILASGAGYVVWYAALRGLTTMQAGIVQLSVPVIAAGAGALLLDEEIGLRTLLASLAILGGIATVLGTRRRSLDSSQENA